MAINQESFNSGLYDLLKTRGYNPTPIDSKGQNTPVPQDADVFKFDFKKSNGKEDFGPVWATIDNAAKLIIYYDDDIADSGDNNTSGTGFSDSWPSLLKVLKRWAMRKQLGFELKNRDHLGSDMAQREHVKKKEALGESYHSMGNTTSYNDAVPQVKIIIQHTRKIEEGEKRFHNIERIFVENTNGETFAIPTKRPGIAKVYARHVAEGGSPYDERGKHITSLVEEYTKMAGFVRATKNGTFNESAQQLINEGLNHYQSLRETLSRMIGNRGYNTYFESWTPTLMETEGDEINLNELFVKETLDPRIESVMPILKRLSKNIGEMKEVSALAEWANNVTEEESLKSNNPIGIPEGESKERPYICVHVKKGKCEVKANSSYEAAQKAAQHWKLKSTAGIDAHLADVTHDPASLNEVTRLSSAQDAGNVFELYKEYLDSFDFEEDNIDKSNSNWEDYFISGALNFLHKKGIPVRFRKTIVKDMLNMFDPNATKELPFNEAIDLNTITEPTADDEEKRKQSAENIKKMLQRAIEFMNQLRTRSVTPKEEKQLQEVANLFGTIAEDPILQLALHKIGVSEKDLNDVVEKAMLLIGEPDSEYVHENGEIEENFINMVPQAVAEGSENILPKGTSVTVLHKGKQVPGKIVRYDTGKGGYSSAYVVDIGKYESIFVPASKIQQGVAEGSGGNWYIRVNGKILNDTKFKPVIFSSKDEARSHAMKLADKKRIPLSQIKLTKSWMDAPEPGVAEGLDANQKRAGQLGPTEKVGKNEKNLRGRLVGNESVDPEIIRIRKLSGI